MNQLFNPDNIVWTFLTRCVDLVILSLLWLLFSLPVVTAGASTAALYHSVRKSVLSDSGYAVTAFWKSFRENVKQGIPLMLLCALPFAFCFAAWLFADSLGEGSILGLIYHTASILVGVMVFSTAATLFPLLSRFYMKTPELIKTAFALAVTRAGFTLILDLILVLCGFTVYMIHAGIFVLPGAAAMAAERLLEPGFRKILADSQARE